MRLHGEDVKRRSELVRGYFRQNPHSGIKQAQEFLTKQGERTMNHRGIYKLRDEVRKELFRQPGSAPTTISGEKPVAGLSAPILSAVRALASLMASQKVESLTVSLAKEKPLVRFVKQTVTEGEVKLNGRVKHESVAEAKA